jgi:hypothetical protein
MQSVDPESCASVYVSASRLVLTCHEGAGSNACALSSVRQSVGSQRAHEGTLAIVSLATMRALLRMAALLPGAP